MNITIEEVSYGVKLGYKLGRMEFIWDSPYEDAKKEFDKAKAEIISILKTEGCEAEQDSYMQFVDSILRYFERKNIKIYSMILVGIGSFRNMIASSVNNNNPHKDELMLLAKNSFDIIPPYIVPDAMELLKKIKENNAYTLQGTIEVVCNHLNIDISI